MNNIRYLKHSDRMDPPDQRTMSFAISDELPPDWTKDEEAAFRKAVADRPWRTFLMANAGTVECAHKPSAWDRAKWVAAFLLTGLAAGAVIVAVVNHFIA